MSTHADEADKATDRTELKRDTSVGYKLRPSLLLAADPDDVLPDGEES